MQSAIQTGSDDMRAPIAAALIAPPSFMAPAALAAGGLDGAGARAVSDDELPDRRESARHPTAASR
jgi:hypothetical protein